MLELSPDLGNIDLGFVSASGNLLWIVFGFVVAIVGLIALVLMYHWVRYGFGHKGVYFGGFLYIVVSVLCVILMFVSITSYT